MKEDMKLAVFNIKRSYITTTAEEHLRDKAVDNKQPVCHSKRVFHSQCVSLAAGRSDSSMKEPSPYRFP